MATQVTTVDSAVRSKHEPSSTSWFWWKETRQLAPLLVMLIAVAFLSLFFDVVGNSLLDWRVPHEALLLAIPGLFATGAGPLLVGQERAQRTIEWLMLLPISPRRLSTTKLLVSLVGLAIMWVIALMLLAFLEPGSASWSFGLRQGQAHGTLSLPVWLVHSIFVLLVGFYVSWRVENQFYALLLLILIAFSPFIAVSLTSTMVGRPLLSTEFDRWSLVFTCVGVVAMVPLSTRAAVRTLSAKPAPRARHLEVRQSSAVTSLAPRFKTHLAPIIWQSIGSAKGTWWVITAMFAAGAFASVVLVAEVLPRSIETLMPFLILLTAVAASWVGVCTFKHDGSTERLRFLADRGVSWKKTYLALHAFPVAFLSTALLLFALWNIKVDHFSPRGNSQMPSLLTMLFVTALVYSVSQWISQMFRTLILSVIVAPILAWAAVGWLGAAFQTCGFPIWGMVLCLLAPLVASFLLMNRYMDGRDRPWTFAVGAVVVVVIIGLPVLTSYRYVQSIPAMSSQQRTTLLNEALLIHQRATPANVANVSFEREIVDQSRLLQDTDLERKADAYRLDPDSVIENLRPGPSGEVQPGIVQGNAFSLWYGGFSLARLTWESDPEAWPEYAKWLTSSAILTKSLRAGPNLLSQEWADRLEIMLLDALASESIRSKRETDAVRAVVDAIGDRRIRAQARRDALLQTWRSSLLNPNAYWFGFGDHSLPTNYSGLSGWAIPRKDEAMVLALLDGIEASKQDRSDTDWLRRMHQLADDHPGYQWSSYHPSQRERPAIEELHERDSHAFSYGLMWGRAWESLEPKALLSGEERPSTSSERESTES
ncbi:ABC transporter permease [Roseiconus lacunae]|uniref:ABC transporter permease n=1 Tax=Roseiconus lacunae TaxID=2605694 RepID=UPI001E518E11|nr:ABC transporter permease [Roseiconus lacunae]MCD0463148.1 ABC transporter permease [Roseiconus lacunae]